VSKAQEHAKDDSHGKQVSDSAEILTSLSSVALEWIHLQKIFNMPSIRIHCKQYIIS